ncbi:phage holin family protein [Cellvibrio sp.]|uniref:phage holin family protein n=1 Tax=Cellvibrio sp. TaxID=1965322 RepID=UPI0039648485
MAIANSGSHGKDPGSPGLWEWIKIFRSAKAALFSQAALHLELAQVEWQEEKQRLVKLALAGVLGFIFFLSFVTFASALIIASCWDTPYRIHAFIGVTLLHFLGLVWAVFCVKKFTALSKHSFAATRAEIASDIALLKSAL